MIIPRIWVIWQLVIRAFYRSSLHNIFRVLVIKQDMLHIPMSGGICRLNGTSKCNSADSVKKLDNIVTLLFAILPAMDQVMVHHHHEYRSNLDYINAYLRQLQWQMYRCICVIECVKGGLNHYWWYNAVNKPSSNPEGHSPTHINSYITTNATCRYLISRLMGFPLLRQVLISPWAVYATWVYIPHSRMKW